VTAAPPALEAPPATSSDPLAQCTPLRLPSEAGGTLQLPGQHAQLAQAGPLPKVHHAKANGELCQARHHPRCMSGSHVQTLTRTCSVWRGPPGGRGGAAHPRPKASAASGLSELSGGPEALSYHATTKNVSVTAAAPALATPRQCRPAAAGPSEPPQVHPPKIWGHPAASSWMLQARQWWLLQARQCNQLRQPHHLLQLAAISGVQICKSPWRPGGPVPGAAW
jgi:hypothetical protein